MQALGLIETRGLVVAIESADAMLKAADVNLLEKTYVGAGLVLIAVTGDVAAVKAAVEAGGAAVKKINNTLLVSQHVIPRPHESLNNVIVTAAPLKSAEIPIVVSVIEESPIEITEEDTLEVPVEVEETVVENLVVEDTTAKEILTDKASASLKMDLSELHNKEAVDKLVLEYGLEGAIEVLSKFKVKELRKLAREYKNFGITGRSVSKADKRRLLTEFKEYYGNN
jgi:microcompartment protein CcmL/EutN